MQCKPLPAITRLGTLPSSCLTWDSPSHGWLMASSLMEVHLDFIELCYKRLPPIDPQTACHSTFTQITQLPRLPGQMSARCPVAASLHLPLGSAPQFEGLLVCFSGRQQRRPWQRRRSGVPLRVAWRLGLGSKAGPESSSRSGSYSSVT